MVGNGKIGDSPFDSEMDRVLSEVFHDPLCVDIACSDDSATLFG